MSKGHTPSGRPHSVDTQLPILHMITLKGYEKRRESTIKIFKELGIEHKIFEFEKNKIPWKGCLSSHLSLYKYAKSQEMEYIFIVEDNIDYGSVFGEKEIKELMNFVNNNKRWDSIVLGGFILPYHYVDVPLFGNVHRTKFCHGTSCYVIHRRLYEYMLEIEINEPIDVHLSKYEQYIFNPMLFFHSNSTKSIVNPSMDLFRKIWFHPASYKIALKMYFGGYLHIFFWIVVTLLSSITLGKLLIR